MRTKARFWLALAVLVAVTPLVSACYTTKGAGEDLSAAGKGLERSADKNTGYKPSSFLICGSEHGVGRDPVDGFRQPPMGIRKIIGLDAAYCCGRVHELVPRGTTLFFISVVEAPLKPPTCPP